MKPNIFIFSIVLISFVPLVLSGGSAGTPTPDPRCVPDPCDPDREQPCFFDPDLGRPRCTCRPGFVRFAGSCVSIDTIERGCNSDSDCLKTGETCQQDVGNANSGFKGVCQCRQGFRRDWETGDCLEIPNPWNLRGFCQVAGDPHIKAFDLLGTYDYQGKCDYVLVRDTNLEIQGRFSSCGNRAWNVSCVDRIAFLAGSSRVEFTQDGVFVNGSLVDVPVNISGVVITNTSFSGCTQGRRFRAVFPDGVIIDYGLWCFGVQLPEPYFRNDTLWPVANFGTKGLCASWTNKTQDDGITRDGQLLDLNSQANITTFAESWKLPASENLFSTPNDECPLVKRGGTATGGTGQTTIICQDKNKMAIGISACTAISINPLCRDRYPWQSLLIDCLYDYCLHNSSLYAALYQAQANGLCDVDQNGLPPKGSGVNGVNPFDRTSFTDAPTTNPSTTPAPTTASLARELTFTFWILFVSVLFFN